ncbi:MAG: Rpn family recombination-promoting nuclease/putative transposase [Treponema sp.]|jgi:predicted transposase/invertase (TIGR01784 family)|nr:Rpn family recombination-promoting nuclease/putative transposase [Treponema sp.]
MEIQVTEEIIARVLSDKEALRAYEMKQMALSDWTSACNHAREEGIQEGMEKSMEKGKREKAVEVARNLKAIGIPLGQIAQGTGLSVEEIAKL